VPPLYSANGMFRQSRLCSPLAFLGLAACTEDPRPKSAMGSNSTMAGALRCAPYEDQTPAPAPRASLRDAVAALLAAWDGDTEEARLGLPEAISALSAALASKSRCPGREPDAPGKPREGTKQEQVLAMLRRPEGATVAQIAEATGWNSITMRGFMAGLKMKGHTVEVRERIRQVGPNERGAKGSFTIYALVKWSISERV